MEQFGILPLIDLRLFTNNLIQIFLTDINIIQLVNITLLTLFLYSLGSLSRLWDLQEGGSNFREKIYNTIAKIAIDNIGIKGQKYIDFMLIISGFIVISNVYGLIPLHYTTTTSIIMIIYISLTIFISLIFLNIYNNQLQFFSIFFPHGSPIVLAPLIVLIEIISFFSRPISLSVRLAANMVSGHVLLKILIGVISGLFFDNIGLNVLKLLPILIFLVLFSLETIICFLQGYVFMVLVSLYVKESLFLH